MPGIMTGAILALARGAGEVAPLMLVGAAKSAPELPIDGEFPVHPSQRSFMHLGFHIYDVGFQSQNAEAARPLVFTTTLLLIIIVVALNMRLAPSGFRATAAVTHRRSICMIPRGMCDMSQDTVCQGEDAPIRSGPSPRTRTHAPAAHRRPARRQEPDTRRTRRQGGVYDAVRAA